MKRLKEVTIKWYYFCVVCGTEWLGSLAGLVLTLESICYLNSRGSERVSISTILNCELGAVLTSLLCIRKIVQLCVQRVSSLRAGRQPRQPNHGDPTADNCAADGKWKDEKLV